MPSAALNKTFEAAPQKIAVVWSPTSHLTKYSSKTNNTFYEMLKK